MPNLSINLPILSCPNGYPTVNIEYNSPMGISGYVNLGNTCFLNSCLQVLNHTYELMALHKSLSQRACMETDIWNEYDMLRSATLTNNQTINPLPFVKMIHTLAMQKGKTLFTGWAQNDMPEFLLFMIDIMHQSICRKTSAQVLSLPNANHSAKDNLAKQCLEVLGEVYSREYSEIMDLFYGLYVSKISSLETPSSQSFKPDPFFILDLPIPDPTENRPYVSIHDCFNQFVSIEELTGENMWFNETTGKKENATKQMMFWNLPPILVICLKRFTHEGHKKHTTVVFPIDNLDLSQFVVGYNSSSYKYDLYGVCNHMGTTMGGHYNSFVRNILASPKSQWICYDDSHTSIIDDPVSMITPMAYCLFYRRKNMIA